MASFLARRQYDSPIFNFGIQGISRTNIESPAKRTGQNDLPFSGYPSLHGKTILPFALLWKQLAFIPMPPCIANFEKNNDSTSFNARMHPAAAGSNETSTCRRTTPAGRPHNTRSWCAPLACCGLWPWPRPSRYGTRRLPSASSACTRWCIAYGCRARRCG
jgi:hypothetical protein